MTKRHLRSGASVWALTASSLALALTSPALAQTGVATGTPTVTGQTAPQTSQVDEIVVTAQKRSENLQDVPITISAFSAKKLENTGVTNTAQLTTVTPGLTMRQTNGSLLPTIRGVGTSGGFVENPAAVYVDGVYLAQQQSALRELNDIAQVAVLKGPQGTLFGRNSTAGVIQITTLAPSHTFRAEIGASLDDYQTLKTDLYVTGALTDDLAGSLSAYYGEQGEGFGHNYTTGHDTYQMDHSGGVRGKLLFEPSELTKITLIGEYSDAKYVGLGRAPYPGTVYVYPGFGPVSGDYDTYGGLDGGTRNTNRGASVTVEQNLGFADLLSISSYHRLTGDTAFDNDGVAGALAHAFTPVRPSETWTQELQLSSHADSAVKWVVGAFYFHNSDEIVGITRVAPPFFPVPGVVQRESTQVTESFAGFGQATWAISADTNLTGGVRYTTEKRDFDGKQIVTIGAGAPATTTVTGNIKADKPTFRLSLDHQFTPDVLGYVSVNTGFKSGGYNLLAPLNGPYQPETLKAYETGLKTQLLDRRVRINASAFYYEYSNIQVGQIVNNQNQISNGAKAKLYGLDVDFEAHLTPSLTVSGGLEALHTEFLDYPNAQIARRGPTGAPIISVGSAAGNRLPGAQELSANAAFDYDTAVRRVDLHYNLTASYSGDYAFEPDNLLTQDAYVMLNTSLRATLPGGKVSLTVWGKNLLDEVVISNANASPQAFTAMHEGAPRTFGASVRYSF